MYKIYINETRIVLLPSKQIPKEIKRDDENMVVRYSGKVKHLLGFIDMCEKTDQMESITIHSDEYKKLKSDFLGLFKVVEAAGGLVVNEKNEILLIHRRGFWDLPKGKMEKGETRRETAAREVIEETGIKSVQLDKKLLETNHTYKNGKGVRCIKLSHWYLMFGKDQPLVPQAEEDIEKSVWMTMEKFQSKRRRVYPNIELVLSELKTNKK